MLVNFTCYQTCTLSMACNLALSLKTIKHYFCVPDLLWSLIYIKVAEYSFDQFQSAAVFLLVSDDVTKRARNKHGADRALILFVKCKL